jgi:hypothetical protein
MIKKLLILILTLYAPVELTRVIYYWGIQGQFSFEIVFIWMLYAAGITLVWDLARKTK